MLRLKQRSKAVESPRPRVIIQATHADPRPPLSTAVGRNSVELRGEAVVIERSTAGNRFVGLSLSHPPPSAARNPCSGSSHLMGDSIKIMDMEKLFSLGDDLINVLKDKKDGDNLMQSLEEARVLGSFFDVNTREINISLEEYERRIHRCKERIDETKQEAFSDSELDNLQTQLEKKVKTENLLRQELGEVSDELVGLEHQRISIESRWQLVKQREKDAQKLQDSLSMCASVTGIIPDLSEKTKVSGYIVDSSKKKIDKFELDSEMPAFEVCNSLWKMASKF